MTMLFSDGFERVPTSELAERLPVLHDKREGRGVVFASLPTMYFVGTGPVTFYLSENPKGPQYPATVRVKLHLHRECER